MSEQELMEQLRTNMDTTPLHTGELPPLDLYMDQVLALLERIAVTMDQRGCRFSMPATLSNLCGLQ